MEMVSPFDLPYPPIHVRFQATLDAQEVAIRDTRHLPSTAARVELYWVTYNFEYRKRIERWLRKDANFKT